MQNIDEPRRQIDSNDDFWKVLLQLHDWWGHASPPPDEVTVALQHAGTNLPHACILIERSRRIRFATAAIDDRLTKERDQFVADLEARDDARKAIAEIESRKNAVATGDLSPSPAERDTFLTEVG